MNTDPIASSIRSRCPAGLSPEDRLAEVAALLAEAILRARVRAHHRLRDSEKMRKEGLDVLSETRTHGREAIPCGA